MRLLTTLLTICLISVAAAGCGDSYSSSDSSDTPTSSPTPSIDAKASTCSQDSDVGNVDFDLHLTNDSETAAKGLSIKLEMYDEADDRTFSFGDTLVDVEVPAFATDEAVTGSASFDSDKLLARCAVTLIGDGADASPVEIEAK